MMDNIYMCRYIYIYVTHCCIISIHIYTHTHNYYLKPNVEFWGKTKESLKFPQSLLPPKPTNLPQMSKY